MPRNDRLPLASVTRDIVACERCPRLRRYCLGVARTKRRAFQDQVCWGRPVPGFGDPRARLWVLGLAPAAHGANRTGRVFTGDASGDWLFAALHAHGFARLPTSTARGDGQELSDAYVSAVVRCAPPGNRPLPHEIARCATYLERELAALRRLRLVLCLGQIAFSAALRLLEGAGYGLPAPRPRFAHAAEFAVLAQRGAGGPLGLLASYHPSRQNTQTGKLRPRMWTAVFRRARELLDAQIEVHKRT
jgi:uracil-DNA glycosylase family 4